MENDITLKELNSKLVEIQARMEEKHDLEERLDHTRRRLGYENARLPELESQHQQLIRYVQALERPSLISLLYSLLGRKERKLYLTRKKANSAHVRFLQCRQNIRAIHQELEDIEGRLKICEDPEKEYQQILEYKEDLILRAEDERTAQLNRLYEALRNETFRIEKYKHILQVGQSALQGLWQAVRELEDADRTWEAFGDGLMVKAARRDRLNEAWAKVREAEPAVSRFQRQLAELEPETGEEEREAIYSFLHIVQPLVRNLNTHHITQGVIEQSLQLSLIHI